jgi:uncharacterized Tic20 family protein
MTAPPAAPAAASPPRAPRGPSLWPVLAHLGAFAAYLFPLGDLLLTGAIWVARGPFDPALEEQARKALNFQLTLWLLWLLCLPLCLVLIGFPALFVVFLLHLILPVVAAVRTYRGRPFDYGVDLGLVQRRHLDRFA